MGCVGFSPSQLCFTPPRLVDFLFMAKDPAFLFYTNDFDSKTKFFTHEQVGIYLRLLMAQHQNGRLTEKQMIFICGRHDEEVFAKFSKDELGLFYSERLEEEITKRKKFVKSRSDNRTGKNKEDMKNISLSYEKHKGLLMENEIEIDKDILKNRKAQFEKFWDYYKKGSKKLSKERFLALTDDELSKMRIHLPAYFKATPEKKFRKDAERYLSNKLWENDDVLELTKKTELPKDWWNMELTTEQLELLTPTQRREKQNNDIRKQMGI